MFKVVIIVLFCVGLIVPMVFKYTQSLHKGNKTLTGAILSRPTPLNATVFGLEIGYANERAVINSIEKQGGGQSGKRDVNPFTKTLMLVSKSNLAAENNLGIKELSDVKYTFDNKGTLIAVQLNFEGQHMFGDTENQKQYAKVKAVLADKYKLEFQKPIKYDSQRNAFSPVPDATARFSKGESFVDCNLSKDNTVVTYMIKDYAKITDKLAADFIANEAANNKKNESLKVKDKSMKDAM